MDDDTPRTTALMMISIEHKLDMILDAVRVITFMVGITIGMLLAALIMAIF